MIAREYDEGKGGQTAVLAWGACDSLGVFSRLVVPPFFLFLFISSFPSSPSSSLTSCSSRSGLLIPLTDSLCFVDSPSTDGLFSIDRPIDRWSFDSSTVSSSGVVRVPSNHQVGREEKDREEQGREERKERTTAFCTGESGGWGSCIVTITTTTTTTITNFLSLLLLPFNFIFTAPLFFCCSVVLHLPPLSYRNHQYSIF